MSNLDYKFSYRRQLPHIQPKGSTLFLTFRLAGSIPQSVLDTLTEQKQAIEKQLKKVANIDKQKVDRYKEQRRQFGRYDSYLDNATQGPMWLKNEKIAELVVDAMHHRDGQMYRLDAFCIMSNHVHMVFAPLKKVNETYYSLSRIMYSLKRYTAIEANKILGRSGKSFWQSESFDHVVRDQDEWHRIINYVLNNPVKAGVVNRWDEWPWSYCKYL
ncbi:MAG: transposase [Chloroflexota bacterium]